MVIQHLSLNAVHGPRGGGGLCHLFFGDKAVQLIYLYLMQMDSAIYSEGFGEPILGPW